MGLLIDGTWREQDVPVPRDGSFVRRDSAFRDWITPDGRPGPTGQDGFAASAGRYHLHVSLACPWAHRVLIMRALKGLESKIPISVTHWLMGAQGWSFAPGEGVIADPLSGVQYIHQLYVRSDPAYSGKATVPVLWDNHTQRIVNNESSEIIRMLGSAFDGAGAKPGDYYPAALRSEIDTVNARVYDTVNNGVYKAGFATSQTAYEEAVTALFGTLDWLEDRLAQSRFLCGESLTEADIRLFTTLVRFDAVYHGHFKCNIRRIVDYPNLWAYARDIYQLPDIAATVNFGHIKRHYYQSHTRINPSGIVPLGPALDFDQPVDRADSVDKRIVF